MAEPLKTVLAGDIGGTKTRIGLFEARAEGLRVVDEQTFASADFDGLEGIIDQFLAGRDVGCAAACCGIAGPIDGRRVRVTNLPWVVDADDLERETGIASIVLVNDLEATAWGVTELAPGALVTLNRGRPGALGNGAVIAAGTGLGEAGMFWDGSFMRPFGCEGGHTSFSPTSGLSDRLLDYLRGRYETVSWERVLSGPGLADLYRFMLAEAGQAEPEWFVEAQRRGDPTPAVSAAGLNSECEVCATTLDVFARLYGEEAGNLALKVMATGGVWIGGGIAPKILPVLERGTFLEGFLAKGRMRSLLESMPVHVILDDRAALIGAARCAATL
ncbi:MAG: glucokinase [Acidobacteriota bacterium]|nr:glucokinase [Acidobacteriota bacterium]